MSGQHSQQLMGACLGSDGESGKHVTAAVTPCPQGLLGCVAAACPCPKDLIPLMGQMPGSVGPAFPLHRVPYHPGSCGVGRFLYLSLELTHGGLSFHTLTLAMPLRVLALPYFELHGDITDVSPKM